MIDKGGKQTVFLGSVSPGCGRFQNVLYRAIENLDGYRCVRMDDFVDEDNDDDAASDRFCRALASDQCDIFMLLLGEDYGCTHQSAGDSYAEREYNSAIQAKMPRMSFFVPEKFEDLHGVQGGHERERQRAFRDRVKHDMTGDYTAPASDYGECLLHLPDDLLGPVVRGALDSMKSIAGEARRLQEWKEQFFFPDEKGKVWLLFPFITNSPGWDTGISIANISVNPTGLTMPQGGRARFHFYGQSPPDNQYSTPIPPGTVFTNLLSSIAPGFQGYLIAECEFYPARGIGLISRPGGNDPAMYVAEIFHTEPPKKVLKSQESTTATTTPVLG